MRKIILGSLLSIFSIAAIAGQSPLIITSSTPTQITKYNGDTSTLSYELTLSLPSDFPMNLYLNSITPQGNEPNLTQASTTCGFNLQTPLSPGQSCTVTYTAPVPTLTDPTQAQTYQEMFQVLDGLGKSADSPEFSLAVDPEPPAHLAFMQNDTTISSLNLAYNSQGTIVVKNLDDMAVSGLNVSIPQALFDSFSSACPESLPPEGTCNISYTMINPTQGNYTLSASGSNAASINLAMAVTNQSSLVFQNDGSTLSSLTMNAGDTKNLTVKNVGPDPAQVFSLSVPNELESLVSGTCLSTTTLAPDASCSVVIESLSGQADVNDDLVATASNASSQGRLAVALQSLPELVFQQASETITNANVSETGTLDLQVKNNGTRAIASFSVAVGDLSGAIGGSEHCPIDPTTGTLSAGSTCDLTLDFSAAGIRPGTYEMTVSGVGALPSTLTIIVSQLGHFTILNSDNQVITQLSGTPGEVISLIVKNTGGHQITDPHLTGANISGSCTTVALLDVNETCQLTYTVPSEPGLNQITFNGSGLDNDGYVFPILTYQAWSPTLGPVGAQMSAIIKDNIGSGALYAGVYDNGGVFKSTDAGQTWSHDGMQGINREIEDMKQIGTYIYAITLNNDVYVYNTADTTPTWSAIRSGGYAGRALAVDGQTLYAGFGVEDGQVYQLTVGSTTWTRLSGTLPAYPTSLTVKDHVLYAGTYGQGIYRYDDGAWSQVDLADSVVSGIATLNGVLYAGVGSQMYTSTDGTNWTTVGPPSGIGSIGGGTIYSIDIWNGNIVAGCEYGVYQYVAVPNRWFKVGTKNIWAYHLLVDGSTLYAASISSVDFGIYKIVQGDADWTQLNTGIYATSMKAMVMGSSGLYTADHVGVDRYAGSSPVWSEVDPTNQPYNVESLYAVENSLYAGTRFGYEKIDFSDTSPTWSAVSGPPNEWIAMMLEWNNSFYVTTNQKNIYELNDSTWSLVGGSFNSNLVGMVSLNSDILYAAAYSDGVYGWDGTAWTPVTPNGLPTDKRLTSLVVFNSELVIGDDSGIYTYTPGSNQWQLLTNSPSDVISLSVVNGVLYAMTDRYDEESVYRYDDTHQVWYLMNEGVPANLYGKDLAGNASTLYLDSNGLGVYKSNLS